MGNEYNVLALHQIMALFYLLGGGMFLSKAKNTMYRAKEMALPVKGHAIQTGKPELDPWKPQWKARTVSWELSSDIHTHIVALACPHSHVH